MIRMVAASKETDDVQAGERSHDDGAAPGDRLSGLQEATHRHEPSAERIEVLQLLAQP